MKKTLLIIMAVLFVLFTACSNKNTEIYFNKSDNFETSGARLVEPIIVTENEFLSNYDINLSGLTQNTNQKIQYRLEYTLDADTVQADLNALSNGVVTITENDVVIFVMYVSNVTPIISYAVENDSIQTSRINNIEARLFDLSKENDSILYGEFKLNEYFITCSMYNKTQSEMVSLLTNVMSDNTITKATNIAN